MQLAEFSYQLPQELVAQEPLADRSAARLMVIDRKTRRMTHDQIFHLSKYLPQRCVLVINNSKVIPARLIGTKERSGGKVEVFLLRQLPDKHSYEALLKPNGRIRDGDRLLFNGSRISALVTDRQKGIVSFNRQIRATELRRIGHVPLPPYIQRPDQPMDQEYYQTVYARHPGSVAAPTAGLHFTNTLLEKLKYERHTIERVTLHVNYATFKPVVAEDITHHQMHFEDYRISEKTFSRIQKAKETGRQIVAVGTTSCRVLETVAKTGKTWGRTDLFIYPGFSFRMTDILLTNFHLPHSTLLMLVYAFGGADLLKQAYHEAIKLKYRFYSYGDAMLLL